MRENEEEMIKSNKMLDDAGSECIFDENCECSGEIVIRGRITQKMSK